MTFVAHRIRKSTRNLMPGQSWLVASIEATKSSDGDLTDGTSHEGDDRIPGGVPPGKNIMKMSGPVTIHGYSCRVFSDFFGSVQQGVSVADTEYTRTDDSGNEVHDLGIMNAASDGDTDASRLQQLQSNAVKNLEYIDGYRYSPSRSSLESLLQLAGLGSDLSDADWALNYPKGLRLGKAHLQKKFNRTKLKHVGGGKYRKQKKSGFVLVPNTPTEFFSIGITNRQDSTSENNDAWDGWVYVDCVIWMSYDNV